MTVVYICIPVHDEERTIGPVLWKIREAMAEYGRDYHLLVVDDASTDRTPEVLARYTRVLPLTIHRNETRQGYAASLETALREAVRRSEYPKRDAVVTLQGDFTEDPGLIPELVKRLEGGADLVASASPQENGGAPGSLRWSRRAFEWLARRKEWPEPLTNPGSGFRAYRVISLRKALDDVGERPLIERDGWLANVALLRRVAPHARRLDQVEAPTSFRRLQRPTRFDVRESLRQIAGLVRSGETRAQAAQPWRGVEAPKAALPRDLVGAPGPRRNGNGGPARRGSGEESRDGNGRGERGGADRPRRRNSSGQAAGGAPKAAAATPQGDTNGGEQASESASGAGGRSRGRRGGRSRRRGGRGRSGPPTGGQPAESS